MLKINLLFTRRIFYLNLYIFLVAVNNGQRIRFESSFKRGLAEEEKHAEGTLSNWKKIVSE